MECKVSSASGAWSQTRCVSGYLFDTRTGGCDRAGNNRRKIQLVAASNRTLKLHSIDNYIRLSDVFGNGI